MNDQCLLCILKNKIKYTDSDQNKQTVEGSQETIEKTIGK